MLSEGQPVKVKKIFGILLSFVMILSLSGCANQPGEETQQSENQSFYTFTDSLGNEIILNEKPQKVAVLFSSYADIWNLAGGKVDVSVGESVERGFVSQDCVLVDEGTGHSSIDLERLVEAQPDLVIATADYEVQAQAVEFCNSQGIPAAAFKVESFEDYLNMLKICCDITENQSAYKTYGTDVQERIDALFAQLEEKESRPKKILFIRSGSGASSAKAKNAQDNFVCQMLSQLNTENIADKAPSLLDGLSLEEIVVSQPDFIFITTMGSEEAAKSYMDSVLSSAGWSDLEAVKNGNYTYLPKEYFHYKPNSNWDKAYEMLIEFLYEE